MKGNEYVEIISVENPEGITHGCEVGPIKSIRIFLKDVDQCLENIYDYGKEEYHDILKELIDKFVNTEIIGADADDFHNLSVQLSRRDEYLLAIKILDVGLKNYPWNIDLLADYIQYGTSICCSQKEDGEYKTIQQSIKDNYAKLNKVPRNLWTWRAYSFSIDYLVDYIQNKVQPEEFNAYLNSADELANSFVEQYASDESYVSLSKVTEKKNGLKSGLKVLEKALYGGELKVAPKCAIRYAEKLCLDGRFEESLKVIQRGIRDVAQTQQKISLGYLYFLSGLSRISIMENQKQEANYKGGYKRNDVFAVFCDFNIAVREFSIHSDYRGIIASQTNALIDKTGFKIPEDKYWELRTLLQEQ